MLNALAAELTQDTVNSILPKAKVIFFDPENNDNLYYKAAIREKIGEKFSRELSTPPEAGYFAKVLGTRIGSPTFLAKAGQTLSFSSRIMFKLKATKYISRPNNVIWPAPGSISSSVLSGADLRLSPFELAKAPSLPSTSLGALIAGPSSTANITSTGTQIEELKREGEVVFEAEWTVTLKSNGALVGPKFIQVSYKSTDWKSSLSLTSGARNCLSKARFQAGEFHHERFSNGVY
jgi:hypothetical protein